MKLSLTVIGTLLACGAASASAQVQTLDFSDRAFTAQIGSILKESKASRGGFQAGFVERRQELKASRLLQDVMVAMYDAPGTGEKIVQWLRDNKAVVDFKDGLKKPSDHTTRVYPEGSVPTVYVDSSLKSPVSYRYLGVLLAREAAELMLADFPESAEKRYIVASRMAETYFELGGSRIDLEQGFDGIKDEAAAQTIRLWIENDASGGVESLRGQGQKDLEAALKEAQDRREALLADRAELTAQLDRAQAATEAEAVTAKLKENGAALGAVQAKIDAAEKAVRQFKKFKDEEKDWLFSHYPLAMAQR